MNELGLNKKKKRKKKKNLFCYLLKRGGISCQTGITDIEIHFLQIKFTAIGVYLDTEVVKHLEQWKGKKGSDLAEDDDFFAALIAGKI